MKEIERIGLLKMDFLGLSTLTLLHDAVAHIRDTTGETIALDVLPLGDAKTYQLFSEGRTLGIFQFESSGMRDTLRKAKPERFEDLIALNALYRPGPLRGGVIDDFIARKQGKVEITYELPALEPILKETYGVIAFQEQVMRIASDLAGFSHGRRRRAAQGDGQEERRGDAGAARAVRPGGDRAGRASEEGDKDLRPDGVLRRVRLQQVSLGRLRADRVPDGVSQGELSVALHGVAAHDRGAEHRQAGAVYG